MAEFQGLIAALDAEDAPTVALAFARILQKLERLKSDGKAAQKLQQELHKPTTTKSKN